MLIVDSINYNVINECIDIPYLKYFFYLFLWLFASSRLLRGEEELLFGREKKYFEKKNKKIKDKIAYLKTTFF